MSKEIDYVELAIKLVEKVVKVIKKEVLKGSSDEEPSKEKCNGKSMESNS